MRFKVWPRGVKSDDGWWTLEIGDDYLVVTDADGQVMVDAGLAEASWRVKTPSFWQSRKHYGVEVRGQLVDFDGSFRMRQELQALLDRAYLRRHPNAGHRALLFGLGKAALGLVLLGIGLTIAIETELHDRPSGKLSFWGILVGTVFVCQGMYQASGAGKWRRLAAETHERSEPRRDEQDNRDDDFEDDR
jgi:hypothetical protein